MLRKIVIAPDSFKGTLSAQKVTDIIAREVTDRFLNCEVVKLPLADGGEGSVETVLAVTGGQLAHALVLSPDNKRIRAHFGITTNKQAIIEAAQSTGITKQSGLHPMTSSTFGFGQLIKAALDRKLRDFYLCIGGTASTDGGCGMAAALGVKFFNDAEKPFVPCGATLKDIACIDMSGLDLRVNESTFTVLCDVDNPLFGSEGAAFIYAPQKGANESEVRTLDLGLRHLNEVCVQTFARFTRDNSSIPGSGAAGGLGFGMMTFLDGTLASGIDAILDLCDFERRVKDADFIITGEGKLDSQSFSGKALSGILRRSGDVSVISICGTCEVEPSQLRARGLRVFEASEGVSAEESARQPELYLRQATKRALRHL